MRALLRTNLKAHKDHNFLTSTIYSLTLGCAIFLLVTANLSIKSQQTNSIPAQGWGANIVVTAPHPFGNYDLLASVFDPVLIKYASEIKDFGYISKPID